MAISPSAKYRQKSPPAAFTLVEMLVVMSVIAIIIGMSGPAINGLKGAGDINKSVYDIAGILEQARAYAMSNSTYVYVGFNESDASTSETARQTAIDPSKVGGRLAVAVVAVRDGTRGFDVNDQSYPGTWTSNYAKGAKFVTIGKAQRFSNLHLVNLGKRPPTGSMARPPFDSTDAISGTFNLGDKDFKSFTPFEYPVGSDLGSGTYTFSKVIQYDPQGVARVPQQQNPDTIAQRLEIGLQQSRGNFAPAVPDPATTGGIAAIQIDGMTGSSHIYRP